MLKIAACIRERLFVPAESVGSGRHQAVGSGQRMILLSIFHGGTLILNKGCSPPPLAQVLFSLGKKSVPNLQLNYDRILICP